MDDTELLATDFGFQVPIGAACVLSRSRQCWRLIQGMVHVPAQRELSPLLARYRKLKT